MLGSRGCKRRSTRGQGDTAGWVHNLAKHLLCVAPDGGHGVPEVRQEQRPLPVRVVLPRQPPRREPYQLPQCGHAVDVEGQLEEQGAEERCGDAAGEVDGDKVR